MQRLIMIAHNVSGALAFGRAASKEKQLIDYLFDSSYSSAARPIAQQQDVVNVTVGLLVANIYDLDEKNRQIKLQGWLFQV